LVLTTLDSDRTDVAYVTVTDPAADSGFARGSLTVVGPDGTSTAATFDDNDLISGDDHAGTYRVVLSPQHATGNAVVGSYAVVRAFLWSRRDRDATVPSADVPASGGFSVVHAGGDDTEAPTMNSLEISPGHIDTTSAPDSVTFTVHVRDGGGTGTTSGVSEFGVDLESVASSSVVPITAESTTSGWDVSQLQSGSDTDGIYVVTVTVPSGTRRGTWSLADAYVVDYAGNSTSYSISPDSSIGEVSTSLIGGSNHRVVNDATADDTVAPSVKSLTIDGIAGAR
jgi:hypothetical protein